MSPARHKSTIRRAHPVGQQQRYGTEGKSESEANQPAPKSPQSSPGTSPAFNPRKAHKSITPGMGGSPARS